MKPNPTCTVILLTNADLADREGRLHKVWSQRQQRSNVHSPSHVSLSPNNEMKHEKLNR